MVPVALPEQDYLRSRARPLPERPGSLRLSLCLCLLLVVYGGGAGSHGQISEGVDDEMGKLYHRAPPPAGTTCSVESSTAGRGGIGPRRGGGRSGLRGCPGGGSGTVHEVLHGFGVPPAGLTCRAIPTPVAVTVANSNTRAPTAVHSRSVRPEIAVGNLPPADVVVTTPTPLPGWTASIVAGSNPAEVLLTSASGAPVAPGSSVTVTLTITAPLPRFVAPRHRGPSSRTTTGAGNDFQDVTPGSDPTITVLPPAQVLHGFGVPAVGVRKRSYRGGRRLLANSGH